MKENNRKINWKKKSGELLKNSNFKKVSLLIFCIILFFSSIELYQHELYDNRDTEQVKLNAIYSYQVRNDHNIDFEINVIKPLDSNKTQFPACILLYGDTVKEEAMNFVIKALLSNGYMAIQVNFQPYLIYPTLNQLNETLEYLLTRPDINNDQISILGHSRGGLFALLFGTLRDDYINAVICGNFADWEYFSLMSSIMNQSIDFSYSMGTSKPNNVLFTLDRNDERTELDTEEFLNNLTNFQFSQSEQLFGNFSDGTAREVFLSSSYISHASTLFDAETISKEITWLNQALDPSYEYSLSKSTLIKQEMTRFFQISIIFLAIECFLAYIIFGIIIWILSYQDFIIKRILIYFSELYNIVSDKWVKKKRSNDSTVKEEVKNLEEKPNDEKYSNHQETIWQMYKEISVKDQKLIRKKKNDNDYFQEYKEIVQNLSNQDFILTSIKYISVIWLSSLIFKLFIGSGWTTNLSQLSEFSLIFVNYFSNPTYIIFDEFFRFAFVELFLFVIIMANYYVLKKKNRKKIGDYTVTHTFKGFLIATEMFFIYILFLSLLSRDFLGLIAPSINMRNFIIMLPFFYYINIFAFDFVHLRYLGSKYENLKVIVVQLLIYIPMMVPEIFRNQFLPELYIGLFAIILINPIIYKLFKNFTILAFFDYFFLVQTFTYLHF